MPAQGQQKAMGLYINSRAEAGVENSRDASGQNESQHENETGAPAGRLAC